ncbi:hypothetical protein ACFL3C_02195 [Patescibacteria group bacterium]
MLNKSCKNCGNNFEITDNDLQFYKKIDVTEPTFCPTCRLQRRLTFRNERNLFKRKCDMCSREIFTFYDQNVVFPVYCTECWWGDKWDSLEYGREFDFKRPFFPQFQELMNEVPKIGMLSFQNENSPYNSLLAFSKNTYMSPGSYCMEDSYYVRKSQYSKDCLNSLFLDHCELVSNSVNSQNCYNCDHILNCRNCFDCMYLADSFSCKNCFMCSGISNKEFYYKNQRYSEGDYRAIVKDQLERDPKDLMDEFLEFNTTVPKRFQNQINCENSSGDYIQNSSNARECYDCFDVEDSKYLFECVNVKDSMDVSDHDKEVELCYELCTGGEKSYKHILSVASIACPNTSYLYSCYYLSDSFGCDGFHSKQKNCILNRKYSETDYNLLKGKIIEHMKALGEYGEFFPSSISPFPYNHTIAQDYFPLTKEFALEKGYKWKDEDESLYKPATFQLPDDINTVPNSVTKEILECEDCSKNYKIISQELNLCKRTHRSLSKKCPDCRHRLLLSLKNPRKLNDRECDRCGDPIQTTYTENRPEKAYCEKCYLQQIA